MRAKWLILLLIILAGCAKEPATKEPVVSEQGQLYILAPKSFREMGLTGVLIPEFEKEQNCRVLIRYFVDADTLADYLDSEPDSLDLVLGVDNGLAELWDLYPQFLTQNKEDYVQVLRHTVQDGRYRLIPYAYSYLALLYHEGILANPPKTFGELQDAAYRGQIALLHPAQSPWGRAFMHYLVALFGESGYPQLLGAINRNIQRLYQDPQSAIDAVKRGDASLVFAMYNSAIWQNQMQFGDGKLKSQSLKEGSYLYTESAGIFKNSQNRGFAEDFIQFLLGDYAQNMILLKLGLLPVNSSFRLPQAYSLLPPTLYAVNERLSRQEIQEKHADWLKSWQMIVGD